MSFLELNEDRPELVGPVLDRRDCHREVLCRSGFGGWERPGEVLERVGARLYSLFASCYLPEVRVAEPGCTYNG